MPPDTGKNRAERRSPADRLPVRRGLRQRNDTMRCRVARLCERTVGCRVPSLSSERRRGGGLLHTTPHCVVVTALGAELASFASHTERRRVPTAANRRRGTSRDRLRGTSSPKGEMSEANESTCGPACGRKPHCSLRWGLERAELVGGGQGHGVASLAKRWSWLPRRYRFSLPHMKTSDPRSVGCAIFAVLPRLHVEQQCHQIDISRSRRRHSP
jgi:hypothetical protein